MQKSRSSPFKLSEFLDQKSVLFAYCVGRFGPVELGLGQQPRPRNAISFDSPDCAALAGICCGDRDVADLAAVELDRGRRVQISRYFIAADSWTHSPIELSVR